MGPNDQRIPFSLLVGHQKIFSLKSNNTYGWNNKATYWNGRRPMLKLQVSTRTKRRPNCWRPFRHRSGCGSSSWRREFQREGNRGPKCTNILKPNRTQPSISLGREASYCHSRIWVVFEFFKKATRSDDEHKTTEHITELLRLFKRRIDTLNRRNWANVPFLRKITLENHRRKTTSCDLETTHCKANFWRIWRAKN